MSLSFYLWLVWLYFYVFFFLYRVFRSMAAQDRSGVLVRDNVRELAINGARRNEGLFRHFIRVAFIFRRMLYVLGSVFVRRAKVVLLGTSVGGHASVSHVNVRFLYRFLHEVIQIAVLLICGGGLWGFFVGFVCRFHPSRETVDNVFLFLFDWVVLSRAFGWGYERGWVPVILPLSG